jgi:hypothetical protein
MAVYGKFLGCNFSFVFRSRGKHKHEPSLSLDSIFNEKGIWRAYLMGFQPKTKTLGSICAGMTL